MLRVRVAHPLQDGTTGLGGDGGGWSPSDSDGRGLGGAASPVGSVSGGEPGSPSGGGRGYELSLGYGLPEREAIHRTNHLS